MTGSEPSVDRPATSVEGDREDPSPVPMDLRPAQKVLLVLSGLGRLLTEAMEGRVDLELTGNAEVLVITSLDIRGQLRPVDIVSLTGMTSGGVTKLLDRLEKSEFICREYGTTRSDRRVSLVTLTPKGKQLAHEYARVVSELVDDVRKAGAQLRDFAG